MSHPPAMRASDLTTPSTQTCPAKRTPPACLFIGLLALALITVLGLFSAMARGSLPGIVAVACNLALILGLILGHRWAYVLVFVFSVAGVVVAFSKGAPHGAFVLIGDAVVLVPVLLSTRYFFPREPGADDSPKA